MLINNDDELYDNIMSALKKVTNNDAWVNFGNDGKVESRENLYPFDAEDLNSKYTDMGLSADVKVSNFSGRGVPTNPLFQTEYVDEKFTGTEAMFMIVAKEILNYVIANAEVAMKERMDELERNYNTLLQAIHNVAVDINNVTTSAITNISYDTTSANYIYNMRYDHINVIESNVLSNLLDSIQISGGGIYRTTATDNFKSTNETVIVDGVEYYVQIK